MKLTTSLKHCTFCLFALAACKKTSTPAATVTVTTVINPQKDPAIAKSVGFFLDDWSPKSFTVPTYSTITPPSGSSTATINVDYSTVLTKVSKYLFGNNANPYMTQIVTEPTLINNIKMLSPNILRFP